VKLEDIIKGIQPVEDQWIQKSRERTAQLVMPTRALGRLHDISERLCGIQKTLKPKVNRKAIWLWPEITESLMKVSALFRSKLPEQWSEPF